MSQSLSPWLLVLVDFSIRALLLTAIAASALKLLRVSDPSIRHRVWSGVVAGMLALPLLAWLLPSIALPLPRVGTSDAALSRVGRGLGVDSVQQEATVGSALTPPLSVGPRAMVTDTNAVDARSAEPGIPARGSEIQTAASVLPESSLKPIDYVRMASNTLLVIWLLVSAGFAFRLLTGLWTSSRLRCRAVAIGGSRIEQAFTEWSVGLTHSEIAIYESRELATPVTMGWLHPTIVLPLEWRAWSDEKLKAIVAHEAAHVARRDFFVTCVAELNRSLYWFHPVSWWLRRRLSDLAEVVCDDAAITLTGDRTGYARHLLEVAESLARQRGRRLQPALSMASKPQVESRITSILDMTRPLSRGLGWRSAALITLIATPLIGAAAALRPVVADEQGSTTKNQESTREEPKIAGGDSTAADGLRIRGRVIDPSGDPVPEAKVKLYRSEKSDWYAAPNTTKLLAELKVDQEGRFDDRIPGELSNEKGDGKRLDLVVSAPGFGIATARGNPGIPLIDGKPSKRVDFLTEPIDIQLRPEVTIRGRLISIEGQGVGGAEVSVYQLSSSDPQRLEAWIAQADKDPPARSEAQQRMMFGGPAKPETLFPHSREMPLPAGLVRPVTTDAGGNFELAGVTSEDDLAVLRIQGKGITNTTLHVLARAMQPVYGRHTTRFSFTGAYYGSEFTYVTQPSVPIVGIVRDIETKQPLADVPVAVGRIYGSTMSNTGFLLTRTDAEGRYRIEGLPIPPEGTRKYDRNNLAVRPGKLPYIESDHIPIPRGNGVDPVEFNVELRRAVMVKGRLTNGHSGKPIVAEMYYAPFATNDHAKQYQTYSSGVMKMLGNETRYYSDENGNFEIPVVPGRGVIAALVREGGFISGYGADAITEFSKAGAGNGGFGATLGGHIIPSLYHSLKEIDVAPGSEPFEVAMQVDPGQSVTIKFVDPDGKPLSNVGGSGLTTDRRWNRAGESFAVASGLAVGKARAMHFTNESRKLARLVRFVPENGQTEFTVKLYPPSRLRGRIVDPQGRPVPDVRLDVQHRNDPDLTASLPPSSTDREGRFELDMPVGAAYTVVAVTENFYHVVKDLENDRPQNIGLGEMVLDPSAERWSELKSKREPLITELEAATSDKSGARDRP